MDLAGQGVLDAVHLVLLESVALPQLRMQIEHGLPARSDDMDVRRGAMIGRIDHRPRTIET
jgi:hypothetical protein